MNIPLVKIGSDYVNLNAIAAAHWEGNALYVFLVGGRYIRVWGDYAVQLAKLLESEAVDVRDCDLNGRAS